MKIDKITFAGHSAVFFKFGDLNVAIDPWLEGNPLCPEELKNPERLDLIVLTHGHADHAGDALRLANSCGSTVAATYELALILGGQGVPDERLIPMNKGGAVQWNGLTVTLTNAFHSSSYDTPDGTVYAGEPCGVVLGDGTRNIYHAGDTCFFSDMKLIGEFYKPEIAILPIGDRFTMGPKEAALAARAVGCSRAIPVHYDTFPMLTGTTAEFKAELSSFDIEAVVLEPGKSFSLEGH